MFSLRLVVLGIIAVMALVRGGSSLRCRTEDGPSDGELKRVARTCMRKFGDTATLMQQAQGRHKQRIANRENYGYNYEDSEEDNNEDVDDDQYYNSNNNNNRNYQRQNVYNNERGGHNEERQRNRSRFNGNNLNRTNSGNQKTNRAGGTYNSSNNRNRNNNSNQNNSFTDAACIVHCFFNELHMLNNNDYPDRHKMLLILTKDLRDRELRNFYTDTIQECFRYLENQRRRDKCKFSRDLITCMTEYAKGNCDDWNEFNMVFN